MLIISNNIYPEIVDIGNKEPLTTGQEGELLITSFVNRINPFIRYAIGDKGIIYENKKCQCGCESKVIELTSTRVHECIEMEDGSKINSYIFVHIIEVINRDYG